MQTSRRDFLKTSAILGASTLASAPVLAQAAAAGPPADICIARWKGDPAADVHQLAAKLTQQAVQAIGGLGRFVKKGDVVWVKPNMGWDRTPEQAANTNPDVLKAIIKMCYEAGAAKVKVGDNPCNDIQKCYTNSGLEAAAKDAGAEVVILDRNRFKEVKIGGKRLDSIPIYPDIMDANLVISVPIAKHHSATQATLCMKNYMGVIENRKKFHQDLPGCIADLTAYMKPKVSILDAVRILTAHGPTGGDLKDVKRMDTVAAGVDIVALDAIGAEILGYKPADIGTIKAGEEYGLGKMDYRSLNLKELEVV